MDDVVILLPGIMGSALREESGDEIWNVSSGAAFNTLHSLGDSFQKLELDEDEDDSLLATKLVPGAQIMPGFWKVDGYTRIRRALRDGLGLERSTNFFTFPYDWRRDNRLAAKKLREQASAWLQNWRDEGHPDAEIILVAHSMGGLVARYYLEVLGGWRHARALVTCGTPYRGSLKALDMLANGFEVGWGPVGGDLSETVRSFESLYQLLPTYDCVANADDDTPLSVDELEGLAGLDEARVEDGREFHREIEEAQGENVDDPEYEEHGYRTVAVVETRQLTPQSARLGTDGIQCRGEAPDGDYHAGDGTIPRPSAEPKGLVEDYEPVCVPTKHSGLHNARMVLDHVRSLVECTQIDWETYRERMRRRRAEWSDEGHISLDVDDLHEADEPMTFSVTSSDPEAELFATMEDPDASTASTTLSPDGRGEGTHRFELDSPEPGAYRITVNGNGVRSVSDIVAGSKMGGTSRARLKMGGTSRAGIACSFPCFPPQLLIRTRVALDPSVGIREQEIVILRLFFADNFVAFGTSANTGIAVVDLAHFFGRTVSTTFDAVLVRL